MQTARVPYQKILFVCVNEREAPETCCANRQSLAIAEALKARIKTLGLSRVIRVSKSGCLDVCAKGPNVMVFSTEPVPSSLARKCRGSMDPRPDYVWYSGVTLDDVERILTAVTRDLQPAGS